MLRPSRRPRARDSPESGRPRGSRRSKAQHATVHAARQSPLALLSAPPARRTCGILPIRSGHHSRVAPLISLLTDFGTRDPWVAICKGVILSIAPDVRILDITHEV